MGAFPREVFETRDHRMCEVYEARDHGDTPRGGSIHVTKVSPPRYKRWVVVGLAAVASLTSLGIAAAAGVAYVQVHRWTNHLKSLDTAIRAEALTWIGYDKDPRACEPVRDLIAREEDRGILDLAAWAAVRLHDRAAIEPLLHRAETGPDDAVRANLLMSAARLSQRDIRLTDRFLADAQSAEPYRRMGGALGLMLIGDPQGGELAIRDLAEANGGLRNLGLNQLARVASPMTQAIGQPMEWLDARDPVATNEQLAQLADFWRCYVTPKLLGDALTRVYVFDPQWFEMSRLIHARERVAKWLQ